MKRITAILLCLLMTLALYSCSDKPISSNSGEGYSEPPAVTLPDGSIIYSEEPFVEFPQTGEYKETALLTNVPGQGVPVLLDIRSDGTIDYIFADVSDYEDFHSFTADGACYYTIAPDGTASKQDAKWMEELDRCLNEIAASIEAADASWSFNCSSEEGVILVLAQYHKNGQFFHTALFKSENDNLTEIPVEWQEFEKQDFTGYTYTLDSADINYVELVNGFAVLGYKRHMYVDPIYVSYRLDGTLVSVYHWVPSTDRLAVSKSGEILQTADPTYITADHKRCTEQSEDLLPWDSISELYYNNIPEIDDPTLYYLDVRHHNNLHMSAYGANDSFCYWFQQTDCGVLMRYDYNPEEAPTDPEILTVWAYSAADPIVSAVSLWNHTHATPIAKLLTVQEELAGTNQTSEDIITRLNLELLNNQGPDVLFLDGLNVDKYLEFMAPLDQVNTEGVFPTLVDRFTLAGELVALPTRITPYLLGRKAEGTQEIESLRQFADVITTATDVVDLSDEWENPALYTQAQYFIKDYSQLFGLWYPAWQDAMWEGGKLNKEVFIEFVTQTTRLSDHYMLPGPVYENEDAPRDRHSVYGTEDRDNIGKRSGYFPYTLAATQHVGLYSYWWTNRTEAAPCYVKGIPGPDGTGVMVPSYIAAVRAGGNEDAGQAFVQMLLSRELQYNGNHPVTWEKTDAMLQQAEKSIGKEFLIQNDYEAMLTELRTVVMDSKLFRDTLYAAQCCYRKENRLTPEEAADILEKMTHIYLAEQR